MPQFEQKPVTATKQVNKDVGEYRELLIERHEKDADMRKVFGVYKKAVGAEIVGTSDEGLTIRFPIKAADQYKADCIKDANDRVKRLPTVRPSEAYSSISEVNSNTIENISAQELLGG